MRYVERSRIPNRRSVAAAIALITTAAAACGALGVRGDGPVTSETRDVVLFTSIDVNNGIRLVVTTGATASVEVRAQANLVPIISTTVVGETLTISSTEGFTTSEGVEVAVVTPTLMGLTMSGGSAGQSEGLVAAAFDVDLNGGSRLTANGSAETLDLTVTGGSRAELEALAVTDAVVQLSGGANATIQASGVVQGSASGGAHLTVLGGATLDVESTGGAEVTGG